VIANPLFLRFKAIFDRLANPAAKARCHTALYPAKSSTISTTDFTVSG